jgi:hypothetical protein
METAADLAKKYGLEQYLDKPAELNDAIFNLMLLQETIQLEQARKKKRDGPDAAAISTKRIAHGKFVAACSGDGNYRYAVETALKAGTTIIALFQRGRFVRMLRSMGVPEDKIAEFCDTVTISDDTHCIDQE